MNIRKILLGLLLVLVVLFLAALIGIGVLREMHTFRASISGRIVYTDGNPIPGAKIGLYIGGSDASENRFQSVTDKDGRYSLQTPTLRYALDSSAAYRSMGISVEGYVPVSVNNRVAKGYNGNWDFTLTEAVSVSGWLVNVKGEPMADNNLSFIPKRPAESDSPLRYCSVTAKTDADGNFSLDNVGPFKYRISIDHHSMKQYRQKPVKGGSVDLADPANCKGLEISINDPLDYTVSGHVKDSEGNPIEGAYVWVWNEIWGASTDKDGAFRIIGLDGLGKDAFDMGVKGKTAKGESFRMTIPAVRLGAEKLSFVVQ